jgi:hypothetical protein
MKKLQLICHASINLKHVYIAREHRKDVYALYVKDGIYQSSRGYINSRQADSCDDIFILRSDTQRGPSELNMKVLVCIGREPERLGQLKKIKVSVLFRTIILVTNFIIFRNSF